MTKKRFLGLFILTVSIPLGLYAQVWDPDLRLTNDPGESYTGKNNGKCVASSGDTVHVVWLDDRDGNDEIYYKRSVDAGTNWGPDTRLTNDKSGSYYP